MPDIFLYKVKRNIFTMLTTPPLTTGVLATLQDLGITTRQDLRQIGAIKTFLLLKAAGHTITRSTLWQLEALSHGIRPQDLSEAEKTALLKQLADHPPVAVFPRPSEMENFMRIALEQAAQSAAAGEIPVGAAVVKNGSVIAAAHNTCIQSRDVSRHAEISALAQAGAALGNYRLDGCDVYVTLEPCAMCASALIQARVARVIFGADEPKTGAAGSIIDLFAAHGINKHTAVTGGILEKECRTLLQQFFREKRRFQP